MDCSTLSDEELGQMLKDYGVDIGPINIATRKTYERKLEKLKTGQVSPPSQHFEPVDDDDDDEVQLRVPTTSTPLGTGTPILAPQTLRSRTLDATNTPRMDFIDSRPNLASARRRETQAYQPQHTGQGGAPMVDPQKIAESRRGGIPAWVKGLVFLVVALLAWLIYSNMEPAATPSLPNKMEV